MPQKEKPKIEWDKVFKILISKKFLNKLNKKTKKLRIKNNIKVSCLTSKRKQFLKQSNKPCEKKGFSNAIRTVKKNNINDKRIPKKPKAAKYWNRKNIKGKSKILLGNPNIPKACNGKKIILEEKKKIIKCILDKLSM